MKECTFEPKLNKSPRLMIRPQSPINSLSPRNKTEQVYYVNQFLYKPKKRSDKSSEQHEYEKNADECTFKPYFYTKQKK